MFSFRENSHVSREGRLMCHVKGGFHNLDGICFYDFALGLRYLCSRADEGGLPPGWSRGGAEADLSLGATKELVRSCSHISSTAGCLCLLLLDD